MLSMYCVFTSFFFFKQKTSYEMRISDWSSDVCSSDLVALDRTGPDDRDLDDEIVKSARLDVRQHRHLRPALDLEGAERVGRADHRIGARIFGRDRREIHRDALMLGEQIKAALNRGEHDEREAVDLHER